jgi:hypothetical protein
VPLPILLAAEIESVPAETVVAHTPLFVPDKTRVPELILESVPLPVIAPLIATVFPPVSKEVVVTAFKTTPLLAFNVIPAVISKVPPLPVTAPVIAPRFASVLIERTPAVKVVPPVYVFVPDSI